MVRQAAGPPLALAPAGVDNWQPMSVDRLGIAREVMSHWERGDFRGTAHLISDQVESIWGEPPGDDVVCHGRAEVAQRFGEFLANWTNFRVSAEELTQLGDDHVLVVAMQRATGAASGADTDMRVHIVFRFAGQQIAGTYWFIDRDKSLRLAGLDPG